MLTYRVGVGETPHDIAQKFGGSARELVAANPQLQRVRDGKLTFLGFSPGAEIRLPAHWHTAGFSPGLGAFRLVPGGVFVDAQVALAACQSGWGGVPSSWPSAITQQAVIINSQASSGDVNYVYYDGKLYEFTSGGNNTWISRTCSQPNKALIPGIVLPTPAPTPIPMPLPKPGGGITPVDYKPGGGTTTAAKSSSPVTPIVVAVGALAAGVGLAYLVTKRKEAAARKG